MNKAFTPTRRQVLAGAGALTVSFAIGGPFLQSVAQGSIPGNLAANPRLDSWLIINASGTVELYAGRVELGQGIGTALIQMAADELDIEASRFAVTLGDSELCPDEGHTVGSLSVQQSGAAVRQAAAEARGILLERAAEVLGLDVDMLSVEDGEISGGGKSTSYWDILADISLARDASGEARPKSPGERRQVGVSLPRIDIPAKAFGEPSFLQDLRIDGMVHGRVVHPPAQSAELVSLESTAIDAMPGVIKVVRDGSFLGVVADQEWQAIQAAEALSDACEWSVKDSLPPFDHMKAFLREDKANISAIKDVGAPDQAAPGTTHRATYYRPFQAHASLAPSAAIAELKDGKYMIGSHSQGVNPLRGTLAQILKVDADDIHIIHMMNAGCYGHNGADDAALEAALLARAVPGSTVRLQWMRDDEFCWEPFGSAMLIDVEAELTEAGQVHRWTYDVKGYAHSSRPAGGPGNLVSARHLNEPFAAEPAFNIPPPNGGLERNAVSGYAFPGEVVREHFIAEKSLRTSAHRGLGAYANVFAGESFIDELAAIAHADPVEYRLMHLEDERGRAVIERAAKMSGWEARKMRYHAEGLGIGMAYARYKNAGGYLAVAVVLAVDEETHEISLKKAYAAVDCGEIINPDGVINQVEGGLIQSASWTLKEEVRFDRSQILTADWLDYPILTFSEVPEVEVELLIDADLRPLGAGEVAQGPMAAAIANAVFDATGARVRDLPITPARVRAALVD